MKRAIAITSIHNYGQYSRLLERDGFMSVTGHMYTDSDMAFIKANYGKLTARQVAEHIGVTKKAIEQKIAKMRSQGLLPQCTTAASPSPAQDKNSRCLYKGLVNIYGYTHAKHRTHSIERINYTAEESEIIATYYGLVTSRQLGDLLGVPNKSIRAHKRILNKNELTLENEDPSDKEYRKHHH